MILSNDRLRRARCAALGNAVVPECVRSAFQLLGRATASMHMGHTNIGHMKWPTHGMCLQGERTDEGLVVQIQKWRPPLPLRTLMDCHLVFDPDVYKKPTIRSKHQKKEILSSPAMAKRWTTPRHTMVTRLCIHGTRTKKA